MATNLERTFTAVTAAATWTQVANYADTFAAFLRGSFHNRSADPALIEFSIIKEVDIPDPVDLPALAVILDATQLSTVPGCAQYADYGLGASVPVLLEAGDVLYLKSDQALTHITTFATLETV